ncbi:MAG: 30S ribosomal protein S2 [bacterium]
MEHAATIEQLLEAGAHYGHLTRRWNPKMEQFIFGERNGIHIIDLRKTQVLLNLAANAVNDIAEQGKGILFIGTKNQAKGLIQDYAKQCESNFVCERWLGGMLTNFTTIRKSVKRLTTIEKMEVDGTFEKITKKERLLLTREKERLRRVFGGVETMTRLPGALFIVDIKKEHLAVKEAQILGIPTIALVDSNTDPESVDFPIPANDDSIKTIELILKIMCDRIGKAGEISKIRRAELTSDSDRHSKEGGDDDKPKIKRKLRERRPRKPGQGDMPDSSNDEFETAVASGEVNEANNEDN